MRSLVRVCLITLLASLVFSGTASAFAPSYLSENWDGYTSGNTPYGQNNGYNWELKDGTWMGLTGGQARSGTQSYSISSGSRSRIAMVFDCAGRFQHNGVQNTPLANVAIQGWFYDSDGSNVSKSSFLGLDDSTGVNNSIIRIGMDGSPYYVVQYYDGMFKTVSTGLSLATGWHYVRMDLNPAGGSNWRCDWKIFAEGGPMHWGSFTWAWGYNGVDRVYLGSENVNGARVDWDDIKVGDYAYVGAPVPEPSGFLVLAAGFLGLAGFIWRRGKSAHR